MKKLCTEAIRFLTILIFIQSQSPLSQEGKIALVKKYSQITFKYEEPNGIGYEKGCTRRDPSDVIKVGDTYYVYYTKVYGRSPGYWGTLWYATSTDRGYTWKEQGEILGLGKKDTFDSQATFTPNIIYAKGKYYLYFTGVKPTPGNPDGAFENNSTTDITAIGLAVADSPNGPFKRISHEPVLKISVEPEKFDSYRVDDAVLLYRKGLYWLYYKGRSRIHGEDGPAATQMGVAFSKNPEGPFTKMNKPLLPASHEVMLWQEKTGLMALASISQTFEYASDGIDFLSDKLSVKVKNRPNAPGVFRKDLTDASVKGEGLEWGISMVHNGDESYLLRYEVKYDSKKEKETITERPNIILFMVDDMGWQDTSVPFWKEKTAFNNIYHTPNMERLAKEGMKFTQAYATAVCSPTRASLMSGMNAARHRVTNWTLRRGISEVNPPEGLSMPKWNLNGIQPTDSIERSTHITALPQILKDNGYFTIHSGKAHFGAKGTPGENPLNLGFDINIAGHAAGAPGSYYGLNNFAKDTEKESIWDVPGLEKYHQKDIYLSEALTQESILAIDRAIENNKPFYLYLAHYALHTPIQGDSRYEQKYIEKGLHPTEAKYASMVEGMDKSLGDLMDYIDKKGITDNTIILFMSDNGGLSALARGGEKHTHNKPLSSGKGSAHEGGIREPMIVKWPGVTKANSTTSDYVIIEDFFPTIIDLARIKNYKTVQSIDGKSFTPILKGIKQDNHKRSLFWHYPNNWGPKGPGIGASSTIRRGDWKLIYYHLDNRFELFNITDDIGETTNLATQEKGNLKILAKELGNYLRSVNAQMPINTKTGELVKWPDEI